jgi:hypothetical protein
VFLQGSFAQLHPNLAGLAPNALNMSALAAAAGTQAMQAMQALPLPSPNAAQNTRASTSPSFSTTAAGALKPFDMLAHMTQAKAEMQAAAAKAKPGTSMRMH